MKAIIGTRAAKPYYFNINTLTRHAAVVGSTGSGKTVLGKVLIEEALKKGLPVLALDPKGDLGGLAISDHDFDFRPFIGTGLVQSGRLAQKYADQLQGFPLKESITLLKKIRTKIYTPKSTTGIPLSLVPELSAPKDFKKLCSKDPDMIADFVMPVSESILGLAGITKKDKALSLISQILVHNWNEQRNLEIPTLIEEIIFPPFETIGSLPLEEFYKEKDRKALAASVNLILSSPAKQAWKHGMPLDIRSMLTPGNLSVFDMRFAGQIAEKQYVVEQILQELYRYLVQKGGTERLKFILYIDELAGLLPPPPANPPSKRLLELLIRQARAFGLGIIVATQSPGDIDYKIFGNLGTRFIGKLRTEQDIEKIARATDLSVTSLRQDIARLSTGEFICNDSVNNKTIQIKARWLYTLHAGPLKPEHLKWINDSTSRPKTQGKVNIVKSHKPAAKNSPKNSPMNSAKNSANMSSRKVSAKVLISSISTQKQAKQTKKKQATRILPSNNNLAMIIAQVKKNSDKTQIKTAVSNAKKYVPHLRITITGKAPTGLEVSIQGPWVFDLTTSSLPEDNYLKGITTSSYIDPNIEVVKHKVNIKKLADYCVREARQSLRMHYYESRIVKLNTPDRELIENNNHKLLTAAIQPRLRHLERQKANQIKQVQERIDSRRKHIARYKKKITGENTKRKIRRMLGNKRLKTTTAPMAYYKRQILQLKRQIVMLEKSKNKINHSFQHKKSKLSDKVFQKAHTMVQQRTYSPNRKDLFLSATIILMPKA